MKYLYIIFIAILSVTKVTAYVPAVNEQKWVVENPVAYYDLIIQETRGKAYDQLENAFRYSFNRIKENSNFSDRDIVNLMLAFYYRNAANINYIQLVDSTLSFTKAIKGVDISAEEYLNMLMSNLKERSNIISEYRRKLILFELDPEVSAEMVEEILEK